MESAKPASESPRLAHFARDAGGRGASAAERAWNALTQDGVPIIENVARVKSERLVTFVWRPPGRVSAASVFTGVVPYTPEGTALRPLGRTGVWYRSYRLSNRTRASYGFAARPLPALTDPGIVWGRYVRSLGPDPLNPRRIRFGPGLFLSETAFPGAPAQPWSSHDEPSGWSEDHHSFRSRFLENSRRVWVDLPPGFQEGHRPYNLLVVLDGPAYQDPIPARRIVGNLMAAGRIERTVVVLVDNARGARDRDLGQNPAFPMFLARELLPWLRRRYQVRAEPARTVLAGSSLGGVAAVYAAFRYPRRFGLVLAQSGAFLAPIMGGRAEGPSLMERFARAPRHPIRFYLDAGTHETVVPPGGVGSLLGGVRHMRDVLVSRGYPVEYAEFAGGHDYACWRGTFADGLIFLLGTKRRPP
jgi:enterochelin esterase-like enzyme